MRVRVEDGAANVTNGALNLTPYTGTGRAGVMVEAHPDDGVVVRSGRVQPADTGLSTRASHLAPLPVDQDMVRVGYPLE